MRLARRYWYWVLIVLVGLTIGRLGISIMCLGWTMYLEGTVGENCAWWPSDFVTQSDQKLEQLENTTFQDTKHPYTYIPLLPPDKDDRNFQISQGPATMIPKKSIIGQLDLLLSLMMSSLAATAPASLDA